MAENIRRPARARLWKRIAFIVAIISTAGLVVFVILSFLPRGNAAFTIRIDDPYQKDKGALHFHMASYGDSGDELEPTQPIIREAALDHMVPTTAELVEEQLGKLSDTNNDSKLNKSQNWVFYKDANNTEIDKGLAQIYTVYLVNESQTDDQHLQYSVQADSYSNTNTNNILDYFRILIQTELLDGDEGVHNVYYGQKHNNPETINYKTGAKDGIAEPISTYRRKWDVDKIESTFLTNAHIDESTGEEVGDGYCENFQELNETNKALVKPIDITIPAGKILRFTYVAYFEGDDMDCHGSIPAGSYLLLSLHFGV